MILRLVILMLFVAVEAHAATPTTHYATSTARGASNTAASCTVPTGPRCTVRRAIELANGGNGDIVSLESGTMAAPYVYSDVNDNIIPVAGKGGVSATVRLTVRAETEGGVIIDGQFARIPVNLVGGPVAANGNSYWLLEGFNARNGSSVVISLATNSNNNLLRRIVAWDGHIQKQNSVLTNTQNTGNVAEDLALFGTSRKTMGSSQHGDRFTCRRCWMSQEGTIHSSSRTSTMAYKNYDMLCENCIFTWTGESLPQAYTSAETPPGSYTNFRFPNGTNAVLYTDRMQDPGTFTDCAPTQPWACPLGAPRSSTAQCSNSQVLGSIAYVKGYDAARRTGIVGNSSNNNPPTLASATDGFHTTFIWQVDCFLLKDFISIFHPSHPQFASANRKALYLGKRNDDDVNVSHSTAQNITTVGGPADLTTGNGWVVTNYVHSSSLSVFTGTANPYTGTTGAQMCKRYEGGSLTNTPLWPWPMNERILVATRDAGAYPLAQCPTCTGIGSRARIATDVTAEIESILGAIPAACRESTTQTFPDATGFNPPLLSTF